MCIRAYNKLQVGGLRGLYNKKNVSYGCGGRDQRGDGKEQGRWPAGSFLYIPIDPNPAVAARVVFPLSGCSRPEKRPFFNIFPHFSKKEHKKK